VSCKFISNNCCTKGAGKTIFLSTTVSFPIFFKQKLKYFSSKKVHSVLTLHVAYIQTKNNWRFKPRTLYLWSFMLDPYLKVVIQNKL